jgi:hypothetical protein
MSFLFDFKTYFMKILLKSASRRLVRLQGKLKLTEKEESLHILMYLLYFSIFQRISHQPISGADLG